MSTDNKQYEAVHRATTPCVSAQAIRCMYRPTCGRMSVQSIRCATHHENTSYTALCVRAGHPLYRPAATQWPVHGADRPEPGGGAKCEHTVVACRTATLRGGGGRWRAGPRDSSDLPEISSLYPYLVLFRPSHSFNLSFLPVPYQFAFSPTRPGLLVPTAALPPSRPAACLHAGRGEAAAAVNAYQKGNLFRHQASRCETHTSCASSWMRCSCATR